MVYDYFMTEKPKNVPTNHSIHDYLSSLDDEQSVKDSQTLIEMMQRITGHEPVLWNVGTIGFDSYHYKYESGREGDAQAVSFYPRKGKLTIYLMDGTARYSEQLAKLGKHTTSTACLYIKRLSNVDVSILEEIIKESYAYIKALDGNMHRSIQ